MAFPLGSGSEEADPQQKEEAANETSVRGFRNPTENRYAEKGTDDHAD
jgi:hypothetical protein